MYNRQKINSPVVVRLKYQEVPIRLVSNPLCGFHYPFSCSIFIKHYFLQFPDSIPSPPSSPSILGEQEVGVETLMERMKRLSEKSESYQITQEELSKRFETVESQSAELTAAPQRSSVLDSDIGLFIEDPTFIYQDFAKVILY